MTPDRTKAAHDLLAFYLEAGADACIGETPVDRFAESEEKTSPPPLRGRSASEASREGGKPHRHARVSIPLPSPPPQGGRENLSTPDKAVMAARTAAKGAKSLEELR